MRPLLLSLATLSVSSTLHAQPVNGGFEATHETDNGWVPDTWASASYGMALVPEAHSGTHALALWNWYWYVEGAAVNGDALWPAATGAPVSGHPTQLVGWFRRERALMQPGEGDLAIARVTLTRWNTLSAQRDTVASGMRLFDEQVEWAPFAVDIAYLSAEQADTLVIELASCVNCVCEGNSNGNCAYFYVDDLALTFAQGIADVAMNEQLVSIDPQADGTAVVNVARSVRGAVRLQGWNALGQCVVDMPLQPGSQVCAFPAAGPLLFRTSVDGTVLGSGCVVMP